jgi:hypothetical protein
MCLIMLRMVLKAFLFVFPAVMRGFHTASGLEHRASTDFTTTQEKKKHHVQRLKYHRYATTIPPTSHPTFTLTQLFLKHSKKKGYHVLPQLRDSKEKIFAGPLKVARDLIHLLVVPDRRKAERKEREIQMNKHA